MWAAIAPTRIRATLIQSTDWPTQSAAATPRNTQTGVNTKKAGRTTPMTEIPLKTHPPGPLLHRPPPLTDG